MKGNLWILQFTAYFIFLLVLCSAQNFYVISPNTFRLGAYETVAIAVDGTNTPQLVDVLVQDFPGKKKNITHLTFAVTPGEPDIVKIKIKPEDLPDLELSKPDDYNYVNLVAYSGKFRKEFKVPLSYKSGYVYIQTDKPIYTPKQIVNMRIISLNEEGLPSDKEFRLQIKNPRNAVVKDVVLNATSKKPGQMFYSHNYMFPSYPIFGYWTATALYGYKFQQNYTVTFELQEYVLPTFTVKLNTPEVILPNSKTFRVSVEAKYVYGKSVKGTATFRLGVKGKAADALFFAVVGPEKLEDGKADILVNANEIKLHKDIGWFPEIERSFFVVEAIIMDAATGNKETALDTKGRFSTSPFVISFNRCLNDFKPGLVSVIEADVSYIDGKPAKGITTVLTAVADNNLPVNTINSHSVSDENGRVTFEIHPEIHHKIITATVKTDDPNYKGSQATASHMQKRFTSKNQAYIALTRSSGKILKPGKIFAELIHIEPPDISDIYYLVISKGKILYFNKLPHGKFKSQKLDFPVTYEMVPNLRVVAFAYYKKELIADSLNVDVSNECDPNSNVEIFPEFELKEPGAEGKIVIRGRKDTYVGLLGVDEAVYALSNKDLLTKTKMFKTMAKHDLGCGPGGGLTTEMVLANAGILIATNNYSPPSEMQISTCEEKVRRKRQVMSTKANSYKGSLRVCCALGMKADLYDRNCNERTAVVAKYLKDNDKGCSQAFRECCLYREQEGLDDMTFMKSVPVQQARSADPLSELEFIPIEEEEIYERVTNRRDFRETWIFKNVIIGPDGNAEYPATLPHSITTWMVQAVSVSPEYGMCVATPKSVESFKKIFIQLNLPYSVVRNEQIEIPATVFNYGNKRLSAIVYMYGMKDLCTGVQEGEKSERKRLVIEKYSAETVTFPLIPLKARTYDLKVVALTPEGSDVIVRSLNVVHEGTVVEKEVTVQLDPSNQQKRSKRHIVTDEFSDSIDDSQNLQVTAVKLKAPDNYVPGTESCIITALGDQFGPTIETALQDPDKLIQKPHGCGEQNMIRLAPTLYTMHYLKVTGQITPEKETEGYKFIRDGYNHQTSFRKDDGSYGAWIHTPSSLWLTAFVIKVFCQASNLVHIDENVMCSGVKWLVDKQNNDGSFTENHPVYHKDLMGGVSGQTPMTAFVLITLQECTCDVPNIQITKARALAYLEEHLGDVQDPMPVAIVAYALALSDSEFKHAANDKLISLSKYDSDRNTLYWETGNSASNVETTAYGLLTQLLLHDMIKSNSIVNWLNTQRLSSGTFPSTQDTVVALQALSEYAIKARSPDINLMCNITSSNDRNFYKTMNFQKDNALVLQEVKTEKLGGMLFINTAGHGTGLLSVKLRYNVLQPPEKLCRFDITVNVTEPKEASVREENIFDSRGKDTFILLPDDLIRGVKNALDAPPRPINFDVDPRNRPLRSTSIIPRIPDLKNVTLFEHRRLKREDSQENSNLVLLVEICIRYMGDHEPGMTIVDMGIFSGFQPNTKDLNELVKSPIDLIQRYEHSTRGVVFYLEKAPNNQPYCFKFHITRDYIVGNTQTSVIKVYDYYNPDDTCSIFYSPSVNSPMLRKICNNGICQCAEGGCPSKEPFADVLHLAPRDMRDRLKYIACELHDYVWRGKVVGKITKKDGFLHIKFLIEKVIKEGIEKAVLLEDETREFLARDTCRSAELIPDQEYLIMGKDGEKYENEKGEILHRYLLDKTSKIYLWTSVQSAKNKDLQRAFERLQRVLLKEGCGL